jgi:hypothetical protein
VITETEPSRRASDNDWTMAVLGVCAEACDM